MSDDRKRRPHTIVKTGLVLKAVRKTGDALGRELQEHPFVLEKLEVAGIRGMHDIGVLQSRRRFLHESLQHPLRAVAVHFHLDAFVFVLKIVRDGGGRRNCQRRMPDDLAFLSRRLNERGILRRSQRRQGENPGENDEVNTNLFHDGLLVLQFRSSRFQVTSGPGHYRGIRYSVNVVIAGATRSGSP